MKEGLYLDVVVLVYLVDGGVVGVQGFLHVLQQTVKQQQRSLQQREMLLNDKFCIVFRVYVRFCERDWQTECSS